MQTGKVVGGVILLVAAIYVFSVMPTADPTVRYSGGAGLAVVGLALLITGLKKATAWSARMA
ncbi:MAG: hypothetical protein GTN80_00055 [Nitrososphaeria archaeon]|nr:hypothetical protein [Nitrososphaeria archaeon]NIQ32040.1 hypothetical protein [Nitrososphaeria archaeon]